MNEINSDIGYRFVGQCIAAVTRVYTLRIDSLYEDVLRFSSFVGRHGKPFLMHNLMLIVFSSL